MKHLVKFFVITLMLLVCTYASASTETKIVYLDMKYILNESKAGKGAQEFLKNSLTKQQTNFTNIEKDLKNEEKDLLPQKSTLTKEEYQKKSDELRKKVISYQSQRRAVLEKISQQRTTARQNLLKALDPIIKNYIEENNISLVVDKKNVIMGKVNLDITKNIVEKLNKALPSLSIK